MKWLERNYIKTILKKNQKQKKWKKINRISEIDHGDLCRNLNKMNMNMEQL